MSRKAPSELERMMSRKLVEWLTTKKAKARPAFIEQRDRPDLAITLNEKRFIGCELTQITPARIFRVAHQKQKFIARGHATGAEILYPWEPHWWARKQIEAKRQKLAAYREAMPKASIWLALHENAPVGQDVHGFLGEDPEVLLALLRFGAYQACYHRPSFDRVLFVSRKMGVHMLWPCKDAPHTLPLDLAAGYPLRRMVVSRRFHTTRITHSMPTRHRLPRLNIDRHILTPQSPEYLRRGEPANMPPPRPSVAEVISLRGLPHFVSA